MVRQVGIGRFELNQRIPGSRVGGALTPPALQLPSFHSFVVPRQPLSLTLSPCHACPIARSNRITNPDREQPANMKLSTAVLGGFLSLASQFHAVVAADCVSVALKEIPSCAQSCFISAAPTIGCGGLDFACQCQQQPALMAAIEGCVASQCPSSSFQAVIDGGETGKLNILGHHIVGADANMVIVCACANGFGGGDAPVGSMVSSISGISSMPTATVIGSYPPSSFPSYPATTTTSTPTATASTVPTAGALSSSVADIRLIGSIVAALAFGFIAL